MRVLVACEFSGIVRDAFASRGHDAWSCDLLPTERPGKHIQGNALHYVTDEWDLIIAHPPCTHLSSSGAAHFAAKAADGRQQAGVDFFMAFTDITYCRQVAIENPVGIMSSRWRKPDQIIQPFEHGHCESKKTCLWLKGLPLLRPTKIVEPKYFQRPASLFEPARDYTDAKGKRYSPTHYLSGRMRRDVYENQTTGGQNKIGPSPDRWKIRSRTYEGIAAAMAEQWG